MTDLQEKLLPWERLRAEIRKPSDIEVLRGSSDFPEAIQRLREQAIGGLFQEPPKPPLVALDMADDDGERLQAIGEIVACLPGK